MIIKDTWYGLLTDGGDGSNSCTIFTDEKSAEKEAKENCQCDEYCEGGNAYECGYLNSIEVKYKILPDGKIKLLNTVWFSTP